VRAARELGWAAEVIDATKNPVTQMKKHLKKHGVL
jgi:hypothetical protein